MRWLGTRPRHIWAPPLLRDGAAYEVEDADYDPADLYDTEIRWRQERLLDAFEAAGKFLGTALAPRDLDLRVPPVLSGYTMWAITRDELGVQRMARFELVFGEPTGSNS